MKKLFKNLVYGLTAVMIVIHFSSCEKDNGGEEENMDEQYKTVLKNFVETTIVPTYKSLAEAALEMRTANEALKTNPTDATMQAASDAWMKARVCWEKSEAFLFGPVGENALDIDGHID